MRGCYLRFEPRAIAYRFDKKFCDVNTALYKFFHAIWGTTGAELETRDSKPRPAHDERLQALAWWDWEHAALRASLDDFRSLDIEEFLEKYESA